MKDVFIYFSNPFSSQIIRKKGVQKYNLILVLTTLFTEGLKLGYYLAK